MRANYSSPRRLSRWLAGPLILIGVIVAFAVYQFNQTPHVLPPHVIATNTAGPTSVVSIPATGAVSTIVPTIGATQAAKTTVLKLLSDKAGITAEVTEIYLARTDGWDLTHLDFYAGHLQGTAALGQGGNFVLAGHVELKDGTPGPFARLNILAAGDTVLLLKLGAQSQVLRYTVTDVNTVAPDDFDVLRNHGYEELTLITCGNWDAQDQSYHTRIVVHARPVKVT